MIPHDPEIQPSASAWHSWRECGLDCYALPDLIHRILWEQWPIIRRTPLRGEGVENQESLEVDVPDKAGRLYRVALIGEIDPADGRWTQILEAHVTRTV